MFIYFIAIIYIYFIRKYEFIKYDLNSLRDLVEKLCDERNDTVLNVCPSHEEFHFDKNSDLKKINELIDSGKISPFMMVGYGNIIIFIK
jgi:hypothetical protein